MLYWQREGSRRKGLVGGRQVAEGLGLKLWAEFCRIRGDKSSQCFRGTVSGRGVIIWLIKTDKETGMH